MKTFFKPLLATLVLSVFVSQAQAQISPVRLKVNKISKKDRKTTSRTSEGDYRSQDIMETVFYTVELSNASTTPVNDIQDRKSTRLNSSH